MKLLKNWQAYRFYLYLVGFVAALAGVLYFLPGFLPFRYKIKYYIFWDMHVWNPINWSVYPYVSKVAWAQAMNESAWGTSNIYKSANNAYGMRPATKRKNHQLGVLKTTSNGDFATFSSVNDSIKDYIDWYKYSSDYAQYSTGIYAALYYVVVRRGYVLESERATYVKTILQIINAEWEMNLTVDQYDAYAKTVAG